MQDLYRFVNGQWLDTHVIPDDRGVDGAFHVLRDDAELAVHELVRDADSRAGRLYASFMDTAGIEATAIAALEPDLAELDVATPNEFMRAMGRLDRVGVPGPISFWVEKDATSETNVVYLVQSGLGLPNEAYYHAASHAQTLAAYTKHVATMLEFLGLGADVAERVLKVEHRIAEGHWDVVAARDAIKTFNPTEFDSLPESVQEFLKAAGLPDHRLVVMMPSYVEHLDRLLQDVPLADWQAWAKWQILHARSSVLTDEIAQADFAFFGTVLSGATQQRDRWKRAVSLAERFVGEEIGQEYVQKHFPPTARAEMQELVRYLTDAYRERIQQLEWMTPTTRERALEKLEKFQAKIGYPDTWRDYRDLDFVPNGTQLVENVRRGSAFLHDYAIAKVGNAVDRAEWVCTPQTVNAFYHPIVNDITFPAAILRAPFFDATADAAENFGAIGAVIGHEIGHGFDDQGSQYDGDGNLESWWTDEDRQSFAYLTDHLVAQFNGLVPQVLEHKKEELVGVNGRFTLGENIGDLGGLGIAVVAYRNYLRDQGLDFASSPVAAFEGLGEFNGLQRLFLSWARVWRTAIRPELAEQYLAVDPHSPAEFRCNVIAANIDQFYEAFEVPEDSPMWIAPKQRVTIW